MSISDESDLTDISDDELEDEPAPLPPPVALAPPLAARRSTRQNSKGKRPQEMGVPNAVISPKTVAYQVKHIYDWLSNNKIDLNPEYQRDVVWSESRQSSLIDSLFKGFCVPPLIFSVKHAQNRAPIRTCIDGKQRLTSLFRFFGGMIPVRDSHTTHKFFYTGGGDRACLSAEAREYFDQLTVTCYEYDNVTIEQEREIFHRVQMGVPLTPAERMRANNGPYTGRIHKVCARLDASPGYKNLSFNGDRGKDFQVVAQMFWIVSACKGMPTIQKLETWLGKTEDVSSTVINSIDQAVDIFCALLEDDNLNAVFHHEKVSILQFIMILFYIHMYASKMSMTMLSNGIGALRVHISGKKNALNSTNYTASERHVRSLAKKPMPQGDGEDDIPASQKIKKIMTSKVKGKVGKGGKEKPSKVNDEDAEDVDMDANSSKKRNEAGPSKSGATQSGPGSRKTGATKRKAPEPEHSAAPRSKSAKANAADSLQAKTAQVTLKSTKKPIIAKALISKSAPKSRTQIATPSRSAPATPIVPPVLPQYPSPAPEATAARTPSAPRDSPGFGGDIPSRLSPCLPARLAGGPRVLTPTSRPSSLPPIDVLPEATGMGRIKKELIPANVAPPVPLPRRSKFADLPRPSSSSNTANGLDHSAVSAPQEPQMQLAQLSLSSDVTMRDPAPHDSRLPPPPRDPRADRQLLRVDTEMSGSPSLVFARPTSLSSIASNPPSISPTERSTGLQRNQQDPGMMTRAERERLAHARMAEGSIPLGHQKSYSSRRSFAEDDVTRGRSHGTDHSTSSPRIPSTSLPRREWVAPPESSTSRGVRDVPRGFLRGSARR